MTSPGWLAVALCATTGVALGQDPTAAVPVAARTVRCAGQVIRRIDFDVDYPITRLDLARVPSLKRLQRKVHQPTRPEVVRAFLLLAEGDRCDEARRAESERLLRAQTFIAQARVSVLDAGDGGVVLVVNVVDEFAVPLDVQAATTSPYVRRFGTGSSNLDGRGITLVAGWRTGLGYRDEYSLLAKSYALRGRPLQVTATGTLRTLGGDWLLDVARPFITDYQRVAWRVSVGQADGYLPFARPDTEPVSLGLRRITADAGVIARVGPPGKLFLYGASLSRELLEPSSNPVDLRPTGPVPDTTTALAGRYTRYDARRVNLLAGIRRVQFFNVSGFDVLEGTQDVRTGVQAGLVVGRGLRALGATEADLLLSTDLFVGTGDALLYSMVDARWQAQRHERDANWDEVMWDAAATTYWRHSSNRTLIVTATWAGGYRNSAPFQLTLGDPVGGLRGFVNSRQAGGERFVLRAEDRWYLGRISTLAAVGLAPFAGVGVMTARDAPFGATTHPAAAIGLSLLAAVPPPSRRLFRLDLTLRLTPDGVSPVFSIATSGADVARMGFREPADILRSRARAIAPSVFNWP
ncbi:MAG: hypothetical protein HYX65_11215 [Gemmatimonadetes bacterium]|nr:hypothetical protein [Gemmatimonadota bacterium]